MKKRKNLKKARKTEKEEGGKTGMKIRKENEKNRKENGKERRKNEKKRKLNGNNFSFVSLIELTSYTSFVTMHFASVSYRAQIEVTKARLENV